MHGFTRIAFVGIEEKPERLVAQYDWHMLKFNGVQNLRVNRPLAQVECALAAIKSVASQLLKLKLSAHDVSLQRCHGLSPA
jgi:hypothetical protein